ncbi:MAG: glycosyltransferase [Casimicrobiaceae bacterium]
MSQGNLQWNDIQVTSSDRDIDFYAIINAPWPGEHYIPERSIVFQMEPWCAEPWQTWGVKTWDDWAAPDPARFLQVRAHRTHLNNAFWQLRATYQQLRTQPIVKTRMLSTICSGKYFDPGHIKRVDFLKFLEHKDDDVVRVDLYARDNPLGFTRWAGPVPGEVKDAALAPYRYFFAAENNRERNFITEKLWEALLTETLCFYWGCPNAAEWVDPQAYIALDLDDFEGAFCTMKAAILANEWEKRVAIIRREKQKVLEEYQFFPTLERVLQQELRLPAHPDDSTVRYHKYFASATGQTMDAVCFIHSYTRNGDTAILAELLASVEGSGLLAELSRLYVVNCGDPLPSSLSIALGPLAARVQIIEYSPDASRAEAPTLELLRSFASCHPGARVLYLHTKGASHPHRSADIDDWRRLMLHFLVQHHADARKELTDNDVVGCNLMELPHPHFAGNFWWANASYLRTLPSVPGGDRHAVEWWVLSGEEVTAGSLHDSGVDHYRQPYPHDRYDGAVPAAAAAVTARIRADRPSICLVMIVRNEAHIVCEALASMLPWVSECVIVDTGSTDGTQDIIRRFGATYALDVQVFERPWRDFGWNRTEALALAREHSQADYLWMFDADDVLEGTPSLGALEADAYNVRFGPDTGYQRLQIFRRILGWRYVGVLHEYPACDTSDARLGAIDGEYHVVSRRLGDRSRDPQKYARDAEVLEAALVNEPGNARYVFYLGQSLFDAGQFARALEVYAQRAGMGGWNEEVFYARYRAAQCLERLERSSDDVLAAYAACAREHPDRAEAWVRAASLARQHNRFRDAYVFARRAASVPMPGVAALFVETADYAWRAKDEQAIAAYYCGFMDESFELCTELLDGAAVPEGQRPRIEQNRDFAAPAMQAMLARYDADIVAALVKRPQVAEPEVTLVITSCRRLELFIATVSSFLNACMDLHRIGRFVCIDDNSSEDDRAVMRERFPFFEFICKGPADRGHARSLNILRDTVRSPWLLHLEDDWQFLGRRPYVAQAIDILEENPELGQVLFNRNYAETLGDRAIVGGRVRHTGSNGVRYRLHEHYPTDSAAYRAFETSHPGRSNAWWPHYSLRPSMLRTAVLQQVGAFDETAGHFEHNYAQRYTQAGFRSAFLDGVHALHTGRLTSERNTSTRANAYVLNGTPQFGEVASPRVPLRAGELPAKVINLARRPDRLQGFNRRLAEATDKSFAARVERFAAVDGHDLELLPEIRHLFRGNDFRYRRGVIGCALSHLALWNELAAGDAPAMLVLEDDVTLCPDFERQLERVCTLLSHDAPGFDVTFLGSFDWYPRPEDDFTQRAGVPRLQPFEGSRFLGGSFAYIVSRGGAQHLLALAERDGIQNGIDRFIHTKELELALYGVSQHLVRAPLFQPGSGVDSDIQNDFVVLDAQS